MNKILVLPEEVRNKIAAGEVVERPASVVKELLENSIDAQANYIDVEIEDAGKKLIRVSDNGFGMTPDDALLSIKRYATSKIKIFDDLDKLSTLGFRGEALASISSVSKLKITTKAKGTESTAWEISSEGGKITSKKECTHQEGTTVEVKNLFFNTPARKKFLKTDTTEQSRIIRTVEEISLSHPGIGFSVKINKKNTLVTPPSNRLDERVADILGTGVYDKLIPVNYAYEYINVTGFISGITRNSFSNNSNKQYFFINHHPVNNRLISQALYDSFQDSIPVGLHPTAILLIGIAPKHVDINVHPTKKLVKFSEDRKVYDILCTALRSSITKQKSPSLDVTLKNAGVREIPDSAGRDKAPRIQESTFGFFGTPDAPAENYSVREEKESFQDQESFPSQYHILGQLHDTYIIIETPQGLAILDQHAANERVLYEKFTNADSRAELNIQNLLIPVTIELAPHEMEIIRAHLPEINDFGFDASDFGLNTLIVKSVPAALGNIGRLKEFFSEFLKILVDEYKEQKLTSMESREKIIRASCRAAVKARDRLSGQEINELLLDLKNCYQPLCCPHGRPTIIRITAKELQRKFQRI